MTGPRAWRPGAAGGPPAADPVGGGGRFVAVAAVWGVGAATVAAVALFTRIGPVIYVVGDGHGIHEGDALVAVAASVLAMVATVAILRGCRRECASVPTVPPVGPGWSPPAPRVPAPPTQVLRQPGQDQQPRHQQRHQPHQPHGQHPPAGRFAHRPHPQAQRLGVPPVSWPRRDHRTSNREA